MNSESTEVQLYAIVESHDYNAIRIDSKGQLHIYIDCPSAIKVLQKSTRKFWPWLRAKRKLSLTVVAWDPSNKVPASFIRI